MTTAYSVLFKHIPEVRVEGKPLGRHVLHDSRSLLYRVEEADPSTFLSKKWPRSVPPFDQGNVGSCTGNAATGALATSPLVEALSDKISSGALHLDENEAVTLYSAATELDPYSGSYPPDDTGSDGLSVAKAARNAGLISGYVHATSLDGMVTALQTGPVIVGVNWYEGFDNPDANGLVKISGAVRGGHEFEVLEVDVENKTFTACNSWGSSWGVNGYFTFSWDTMTQLLSESGDCTQLLPLSVPAPTPTPTPTPTPANDADAALVKAGNAWEPGIISKITKSGRLKVAFDNWKRAHNY